MGRKSKYHKYVTPKSVAKVCHTKYDNNMPMLFEWDDQKEKINIRKHGISFELAAKVFADPNRIELYDDRDYGEDRFAIIGYAGSFLAVSYTMRGNVHRIINARLATKNERRIYEKWQLNDLY